MNRLLLSLLAPLAGCVLAAAAMPAFAGPTGIATLPLLSAEGSAAVKPNLMLLYDNSGSMAFNYTPDYVNDNGSCRSRETLAAGQRACVAGDPPFMSAEFNKQYYNPKVRYAPPVNADGTSFKSLNRANTTAWTKVTNDGYNIDLKNLDNDDTEKTTNLVTGFPDIKWCSGSSPCAVNTLGYTYPDATYNNPWRILTNAYYYTINVAEHCTNANMTECISTPINSPAPEGYPVAATVRWCDSRALTNCQAKYVDRFRYPRFGDPARPHDWFATITIGDSGSNQAATIKTVRAVGLNSDLVITNQAVTAANGANTAAKRVAMANQLARSIMDKAGLARPFTACTRSPTGGVPNCSSFGIDLPADNMVGLVPLNCATVDTAKSDCTAARDGSRAGEQIIVTSGVSTALLTVSGTAHASRDSVLVGLSYNGTRLFRNLQFARRASAADVAVAIRNAIGSQGTITAYIGGTANTSTECQAAGNTTVCLIDTAPGANGREITTQRIDNNGNISFRTVDAAGDNVPVTSTTTGGYVFVRTDIVSTRTSYPKVLARSDCQGDVCTYDEEMTNFANWYGYYKTRNQMMKTAVGQAFQPLTDKYNVGVVALSRAAGSGVMNRPLPFADDNRSAWYDSLYKMVTSGATPVRVALNNVGKMYANQSPNEYKKGEEAIQFACQQNFVFVTTDGYWNGDAASGVNSLDHTNDPEGRFCSAATGCVDPRDQGTASLADVALYWYNGGSNERSGPNVRKSLRPDKENWTKEGLVPGAAGDNKRLHMRTYALGLGVDGIMTYEPGYNKRPIPGGDFDNLLRGVTTGCPWNGGGAYTWPNPQSQDNNGGAAYQSRVDDLWHAAINGRGKYFAASDPQQVVGGLAEALNDIAAKTGAASAAATSTPNVTQEDRAVFSATFTTVKWTGNLSKRLLNPTTGEIEPEVLWRTSATVGAKVASSSDQRTIYWRNTEGLLKPFVYDELSATEKAWFDNKCGALSQCVALSEQNRAIVNRGATIVGWLRGQQEYADDVVLRAYHLGTAEESDGGGAVRQVLGDIASSKPAYLRRPSKNYSFDDYAAFKAAHVDRKPVVFIAANDGMLHAFDDETGEELWAYMPRITMSKLYKQASLTYATEHQFSTDGSPEVADVLIGGKWHSILVAGLNGGGRGYYALDVTDPTQPKPLWEVCADANVCAGTSHMPEMGYSFGNAQFGTIRGTDGDRWVVLLSSGYNNIPGTEGVASGSGKGFLFVIDVATGEQIKNIGASAAMVEGVLSTGAGDTTTPSGFAKITAITTNPATNPLFTYVYGGDNLGKMWRFDFTKATVTRKLLGDAGALQPITTRPDVATCVVDDRDGLTMESRQRVVAFGTGRLLDLPDIPNTDLQSAYIIKDQDGAGEPVGLRSDAYVKRTLAPKAGTTDYTIEGGDVDMNRTRGWYMDFDQHKGERINLDPRITSGTLTLVSNVPESTSACSVGGTSYAYHLNVCTGTASRVDGVVGGLLSGNSAAVGFVIVRLPSGALKMITTTASGETLTSDVAPATGLDSRRTGWRRVRD